MKKVISDVVNFPNGCETVRFTACFVSMFMSAEGITNNDIDFFCGKQKVNCIRCGECGDFPCEPYMEFVGDLDHHKKAMEHLTSLRQARNGGAK